MKASTVPSCVVQDNDTDKICETFAVMQDFFRRTETDFLQPQRKLLLCSMSSMVLGLIMLCMYLIMDVFFLSPYESFVPIITGVIIFFIYLFREPEYVASIQKFYWPFAILKSNADDFKGFFAFDMTGLMGSEIYYFDTVNKEFMDAIIDNMPEYIKSYRDEEIAIQNLSKLENFRNRLMSESSIVPESIFKKILTYSVPKQPPGNILYYTSFNSSLDEVETMRDAVCNRLDRSSFTIGYLRSIQTRLDRYIYSYVDHLGCILDEETDHQIMNISRFLYDVQRSPSFFSPIIDRFADRELNDKLIGERISRMNVDIIQDRMGYEISMLCDNMIESFEIEMRGHEKLLRKDDHANEVYHRTKKTMREVKAIALNGLSDNREYLHSCLNHRYEDQTICGDRFRPPTPEGQAYDIFLNLSDQADFSRVLWSEKVICKSHESDHDVETNLSGDYKLKSDKSRDEKILIGMGVKIDNIRNEVQYELQKIVEMTKVQDGILKILYDYFSQLDKGIFHILSEGLIDIECALKENRKTGHTINRHTDRIMDMQSTCEDIIAGAGTMLFEELCRHRLPIEERMNYYIMNKAKFDEEVKEIIEGCHDFNKTFSDMGFSTYQECVCFIPFWKIDYMGDEKKTILYGLSEIGQDGLLVPKYQRFDIPLDMYRTVFDQELTESIDRDLLKSIDISAEAYEKWYKLGILNTRICKQGVKKLAKK